MIKTRGNRYEGLKSISRFLAILRSLIAFDQGYSLLFRNDCLWKTTVVWRGHDTPLTTSEAPDGIPHSLVRRQIIFILITLLLHSLLDFVWVISVLLLEWVGRVAVLAFHASVFHRWRGVVAFFLFLRFPTRLFQAALCRISSRYRCGDEVWWLLLCLQVN